jgi:hypothetical protein
LAQQQIRKPGWRRRSAWIKLVVSPLALVVLVAGTFQLQPTYILLDIPVAKNPVGYFWYETQRAQLAYADTWSVLYVDRDPVLPESRLLEPGNLRVYYRTGNASERASLAIWKPAGPVHAIHAVPGDQPAVVAAADFNGPGLNGTPPLPQPADLL